MLSVVYDNHGDSGDLRPDWGFGCVIEGFERTVLFDTGADGEVLVHNMRCLGFEPQNIGAVVLSHDHWDHTGGLDRLLGLHADVTVYMPDVFPQELKETVLGAGAELVETSDGTEVCPGISTTPVLQGRRPEQGVRVSRGRSHLLITGCAHPGIAEVVESAGGPRTGSVDVCVGGFHLKDTDRAGIQRTISSLQRLGIRRIAPCHCSGEQARDMMREVFGSGYIEAHVGRRIAIPRQQGGA